MRVGADGRVNVARLLLLAFGAGVAGSDTPAVGGAEAPGRPLVLDGGPELVEDARIGGRGRGLRAALCGAGGLEVAKVLLNLGELVGRDGRESCVSGDEGV